MQQFALNALLHAAIQAANANRCKTSPQVPTFTKWAWFGFKMNSEKYFC